MKQVLFITSEPFLAKLLEDALSDWGVGCHSLTENLQDFAYIIDDLTPSLIVVDELAYREGREQIRNSLSVATHKSNSLFLRRSKDETSEFFNYEQDLPIKLENLCRKIKDLL